MRKSPAPSRTSTPSVSPRHSRHFSSSSPLTLSSSPLVASSSPPYPSVSFRGYEEATNKGEKEEKKLPKTLWQRYSPLLPCPSSSRFAHPYLLLLPLSLLLRRVKAQAQRTWPYWVVYIAYVLSFCVAGLSMFLVLLYGIKFPELILHGWIFSSFLSIGQDILLLLYIYIFICLYIDVCYLF